MVFVSKPLLKIELDHYGDVPEVYYEGKEIKGKMRVQFDWQTDNNEPKFPYLRIEHAETGVAEKDRLCRKTIELRSPFEEFEPVSPKPLSAYSVDELTDEIKRREGVAGVSVLYTDDFRA